MAQSKINNSSTGIKMKWPQMIGILLFVVIVSVFVTVWIIKSDLFATEFTPVTLDPREERTLENKLKQLNMLDDGKREVTQNSDSNSSAIEPEAYSEEGASREIDFTEKELNALLAKNTDLARKLAIDLSDDLVSIKLLMPMDEDFPVLGGKTLRLKAGAELAYRNERPVVILKGVTVMGVPVPNAWLGDIKNVDLVQEFGADEGFWKSFSEGVSHILVEEGRMRIKLKE